MKNTSDPSILEASPYKKLKLNNSILTSIIDLIYDHKYHFQNSFSHNIRVKY